MLQNPAVIALNKTDLYSPELTQATEKRFQQSDEKVLPFSSFTGENIAELTQALAVAMRLLSS
jgi:50S ribosomal subunit-associated GTPase HflX